MCFGATTGLKGLEGLTAITEKFEQEKFDIRYVFNFSSLFYRLIEYSYMYFSRFLIVLSDFNVWFCNYFANSSLDDVISCLLTERKFAKVCSFFLPFFRIKLFGSFIY